jgi:hypothetical protein
MTTAQHSSVGSVLHLQIQGADDQLTATTIAVTEAYNFGYAGRDQSSVQQHVDEMRELGMQPPSRIPALFPIPAQRVSTSTEIVVSGEQTYGEVEFALIRSEDHGWLVTIASDHTDLEIERVNMPKAKAACPDVIGSVAWRLDDVRAQWDRCTLTMWARTDDGESVQLQHDSTGHLLAPDDLLAILEERRPGVLRIGTVVMSGTIGGEPTPGMASWSARLRDPQTGREIDLEYLLRRLPEEI